MAQLFYDHFIIVEDIHFALDKQNISKEEKDELLKLFDATMHHEIMHAILQHLPKKHHQLFLDEFLLRPDDPSLLTFIEQLGHPHVQTSILKVVNKIKKDLLHALLHPSA